MTRLMRRALAVALMGGMLCACVSEPTYETIPTLRPPVTPLP